MCVKVIFESHQPSFSFVGRGGQVKSLRKTWSYQEKHRTNSRVKQGTKEEKENFPLMFVERSLHN